MGMTPGEKLFLVREERMKDGRAGLNVSLERELCEIGNTDILAFGRVQKSLEQANRRGRYYLEDGRDLP